ncbi:hypothetical protein [Vibrio owensii]|uniref:hypothetical protein n=1 Tax=Vibrio owensii TaxID=696485 RepID=UPI003CC5702D
MDNNKDKSEELRSASSEEAEAVIANTNAKISMQTDEKPSVASQNVKVQMKMEDPEGTLNAFSSPSADNPDDGKGKGDKPKKTLGKRFARLLMHWILSVVTIGIWPRFRPLKGGWKGSWFTSVLLLAIVSATLIGERFYKEDVNALARQHLQLNVDVYNDILPFPSNDDGKIELNAELASLELGNKALKQEVVSLNAKLKEQATEVADLKEANAELATSLKAAGDAMIVTEVEKSVDKEVFVEVVPMIEHSTFAESDQVVGCASPFSSERSKDVFNQKFKDKWVNWNGIVEKTNNDYVVIHSVDNVDSKALIKFDKEGSGYYMLKGKEVSMTFKLEEQGSCETPFVGSKGVEQKIEAE